jgi:hypothetical protein
MLNPSTSPQTMLTSSFSDDQLATLAQCLCTERKEAVNKRAATGKDNIWRKAREQFQGIDDVNRKAAIEGIQDLESGYAMTGFVAKTSETRSTVFDNITRSYTETGTAKVADILLPTGKMPWDLIPTPVSEAETLQGVFAKYPETLELLQQFPDLLAKVTQVPEDIARNTAEAKKYIQDYLSECHWLGEIRELILEAGKVGAGVIKGPVPKFTKPAADWQAFIDVLPEHIKAEILPSLLYRPVSECIRVENCFPDPACGHDIQNGKFFWERVPEVSNRQLDDLLDDPAYFPEQIKACIKEGPKRVDGKEQKKGSPFELWIRTGRLELEKVMEGAGEPFSVTVMCNDRIIKTAPYWLDEETFPYDILQWEPRDNSWDGIGVPEKIETPQRGLNAAIRALQDNLAWSVGPQVLETQGLIEPKDGDWKPQPYKHWVVKKDPLFATDMDPKTALVFLEFPNYSEQIMIIINYWLARAEQVTGLPLLLQGQSSTESVGVSQQLQNNATTNLRQIVKACDDKVFIPHVQRYYKWVQQYGPDTAKADAKVIALGSSTLIVREMQQQVLLQLLDRSLEPRFKLSPEKIMAALLEGNQFDAEQLNLSEEEAAAMEEAMNQPDPAVQVAQINAEIEKYGIDKKAETELLKLDVTAQSKNLEYKKALEVTNSQVSGTIAQTAMKNETDKEKEQIKAQAKPAAPKSRIARPEPPPPVTELPEPSPEEALQILGLV